MKLRISFTRLFISVILSSELFLLVNSILKEKVCYEDLLYNTSVCKLICPPGSFALVGMSSCHPWLTCDSEIIIISLISASVVKTVYLGEWKGYKVILSVLSSQKYKDDFLHNLYMIKSLSPHKLVVQMLGHCKYSLLTEYHELGSALNIQNHLNHTLQLYDSMKTRLKLCLSYVSILQFLHNSPVGIRVMCDSNTLEKTLSQYLVTSDFNLVVNDLDATPAIDLSKGGIHCGKRELMGDFIAPEQMWPYSDRKFILSEMPLYDEKTDIFKIPEVCNWFLGSNSDADVVKYKLFYIHKSCKSEDPNNRPNAETIINAYKNILNDLS